MIQLSRLRALSAAGLVLLAGALAATKLAAQGVPVPRLGPTPQAPPPAPPVEVRVPMPGPEGPTPGPKGPTILYSIGQPTDEEQLYLEYVNRSRANPAAEGARLASTTDPDVLSAYSYFMVDLSLMQSQFNTINSNAAPLAMNAKLLAAARWHSGDMFTNQYQGHFQTNGAIVMNPGNRISTNAYNWTTYGENVYAYAKSVFYGYAGLNVDWGPGTGGMQTPPGHRYNIHNATFREVGIGVVDGSNGSVGPQLVTQDFATQQSATPLVTGVVYYDFNGNNFYDPGEGIGGVRVDVTGSAYYAVTADSGGFAVPVSTNGNYTVTFSANALTATQFLATVSSLRNVKVDFVPSYGPPLISGPNPAGLNQSNYYTFTAVGAATSYQWQQTQLAPYTAVEGGESGTLNNVTVVSSPGYSVLESDLVASGSYAFHLAQPDGTKQYLTLNAVVVQRANSQLSFAKQLSWASTTQVARAQVSTNSGGAWQDLWSQAGNNGSGDSGFATVTVDLGAFAGQSVQVRFVYDYLGGGYYPQTDSGVGFYIDDIAISNADQLLNPIISNIATGAAFAFYPTNTGAYLLQVRARINSRTLDWGPAFGVTVTIPPPGIQLLSRPVVSGNQFQLDFTVANYRAGMTFQLWKAPDPAGAWAQDTSASFSTLIPNSTFRATTTTGAATKAFYRVKGTY